MDCIDVDCVEAACAASAHSTYEKPRIKFSNQPRPYARTCSARHIAAAAAAAAAATHIMHAQSAYIAELLRAESVDQLQKPNGECHIALACACGLQQR